MAEHLLLRLLSYRAGADQDHVRLGLVLGQFQAVRGLEHVGHLGRVVLVHLAAVGLDEKLAAHGLVYRCAWGASGVGAEPRSVRGCFTGCQFLLWIKHLRAHWHSPRARTSGATAMHGLRAPERPAIRSHDVFLQGGLASGQPSAALEVAQQRRAASHETAWRRWLPPGRGGTLRACLPPYAKGR